MKKIIWILILLISVNYAQELDATVVVNYEKLETSYREKLSNFGEVVEEYLNNNKFTGDNWEWERIKCSFNIFFSSASDETRYSAQIVVNSQRRVDNSSSYTLMLNTLDNSWQFGYEIGQSMIFNETDFDPLTSLLDFYAFIIIGLDSDSYDPMGGSEMFHKAYNLSALGNTSNYLGWELKRNVYNKRGFIEEILNAQFQQFREDYCNYHLDGIDIFGKSKEVAQENVAKLVENLYKTKDKRDARSVVMKVFFDAKHKEIIEILKDHKSNEAFFTKLKQLDPAHIAKYNEVLDNL